MGCWFSVGPAMLTSANGRKLATMLPVNRVVPESDALGVLPSEADEHLVRNGQVLRLKLASKA